MLFPIMLLLTPIATPPGAPETIVYRDMTVIDVSELPPGSGVLHTFVGIVGRAKTGETVTFKLTFGSGGQPLPSLASLCNFKGHGNPGASVIELDHFDCTISSDSLHIVPPATRVRPFYN
jgi:hypothetical protein